MHTEEQPMIRLQRQFITNAVGQPIGVILPLEEFALIATILEQRLAAQQSDTKLQELEAAARDPLFVADLHETMTVFAPSDAEWWERPA
jgi:hypothetical protein